MLALCDPIHHPCGADYVSDADVLSAMLDHFREMIERAEWLAKLAHAPKVNRLAHRRLDLYRPAYRRCLHMHARVSGELKRPPYRALMKDRNRCAANWLAYCLAEQKIQMEVR